MKRNSFTSFAMFGSMRSGSILLEKYLGQYEGLVCHGELFNPGLIMKSGWGEYLGVSRKDRLSNPALMLDALGKADPDKIPGYRIFQSHNAWAIDNSLQNPKCAKIILTRDAVESFVSLSIARVTDQWLISDIAHRKTAQIEFDLEEFSKYTKARSNYYGKIYKSLALTGQPYFEIDYSMLGDLETINQLAAFIGVDEKKLALEEPIKRQNPGALSEKIKNYKEVAQALGLPEDFEKPKKIAKPPKERGNDLSRIHFCKNKPLAFCIIPSTIDLGARQWMNFHDHKAPENGFSENEFQNWKGNHPDSVFFSVVCHPVERAYRAFMRKIFPTTADSYQLIRHQLEKKFGLLLPQGEVSPNMARTELEIMGYGQQEHRLSFKQFLVFISGNLENNTEVRQDGMWQLQSEIIRRYRVLHPVSHVFKAENLQADLAYLENILGLKPYFGWQDEPAPQFSFALADIYDAEVESLCFAAYEQDYLEFGYKALGSL